MTRVMRFAASLLLVAGVFGILPVLADGSLFGTLAGKVKDESGGALPGVVIEVTSNEKGFQRVTTTDAAGAFTVALLPPGTYRVTRHDRGLRDLRLDRRRDPGREDHQRRDRPEARAGP